MTTAVHKAVPRPGLPGGTPRFALAPVAVVAALGTVALLLSIGKYGFFGDELYFVSGGRRLAVSYADQGPLLPLIARAMDLLAPGSLVALRVPAVVVTVGAVFVSAQIAREFGGSRAAQVLTALAYVTSPFLWVQGTQLATNTIDTALWVLITWLLVRWVRTGRDALLLWAGVATALDMQVKWLIPFFWVAVAIGVLISGPRELLRRPALWAGAGLVVVTMIPGLIWQSRHGWPQLGMGAVVAAEQASVGGRFTFVPLALLSAGLLGGVLLLAGIWALLRVPAFRPYRFLGWVVPLLLVAFVITDGRPYYLVGCYAAVAAAGAVWCTRAPVARWRKIVVGPLVVASALLMVLSLPLKPEKDLEPVGDEASAGLAIGVWGKFGWPELAGSTAAAYRALPEEERARAVIVADSYWQASALDVDRQRTGLPAAYSPNRGFGYFGVPPDTATTVLWVGGDGTEPRERCGSVAPLGRADSRLGFPGLTRDVTIWRCADPRTPWSQAWPDMLRLD
ncbi:4-amino-4-deoxy-L-arabinose transferase-like glycosyltransferase [Nocardia transvalensis]|uniref:4-amino-4-deoxy-L-arabinose transferase-like glycosyltransferase n=1 Tax=Nocardia transvalensis TaxID=37333 RepID=A0A7W9UL06_9NOCA|nr:glycosyltransferase family 39 protein [Nocardia transvalensis]MBB5917088.1 4-amino-4-deoxy-L-arabinose transferase-like glycosyltransferase [Nocardia transvalensis]